jgi:hypothetical protein
MLKLGAYIMHQIETLAYFTYLGLCDSKRSSANLIPLNEMWRRLLVNDRERHGRGLSAGTLPVLTLR